MIQRLQVKRNEKGFTLIELLIVIIVLGILAAIVVFAVGSTRKDALSASCKTTSSSVELSGEAVKTKTGVYPTGTINGATASNPLLAGFTPANGALLKKWPSSDQYALSWNNGAVTVYVDSDGNGAQNGPEATTTCAALS